MINFLSSWVKDLALALIIVSILEMILPNNKMKKYVKTIMGLYILFSIISPFIENSNKVNLNDTSIFTEYIEEASASDVVVDQTSMDNKLNQMYKEELQKDITQKIEEKGYEVEKCKVTARISKTDSGIELINLKIGSKVVKEDEVQNSDTLESKIVVGIQKIQKIQKIKVDVSEDGNDEKNEENDKSSNLETNITKTDIKIIKDFLIKEYGVSEKCLRIS